MTHVTCRLTADQLRNPTLGNLVWATFTLFTIGLGWHKVHLLTYIHTQAQTSDREGTERDGPLVAGVAAAAAAALLLIRVAGAEALLNAAAFASALSHCHNEPSLEHVNRCDGCDG